MDTDLDGTADYLDSDDDGDGTRQCGETRSTVMGMVSPIIWTMIVTRTECPMQLKAMLDSDLDGHLGLSG